MGYVFYDRSRSMRLTRSRITSRSNSANVAMRCKTNEPGTVGVEQLTVLILDGGAALIHTTFNSSEKLPGPDRGLAT